MTSIPSFNPGVVPQVPSALECSQPPTVAKQTKKKNKSTQACDQCWKKKIKCDFDSRKGVCIKCQRNGIVCTFKRILLKRGPSKGYSRHGQNSKRILKEPDGAKIPINLSITPNIAENVPSQNDLQTGSLKNEQDASRISLPPLVDILSKPDFPVCSVRQEGRSCDHTPQQIRNDSTSVESSGGLSKLASGSSSTHLSSPPSVLNTDRNDSAITGKAFIRNNGGPQNVYQPTIWNFSNHILENYRPATSSAGLLRNPLDSNNRLLAPGAFKSTSSTPTLRPNTASSSIQPSASCTGSCSSTSSPSSVNKVETTANRVTDANKQSLPRSGTSSRDQNSSLEDTTNALPWVPPTSTPPEVQDRPLYFGGPSGIPISQPQNCGNSLPSLPLSLSPSYVFSRERRYSVASDRLSPKSASMLGTDYMGPHCQAGIGTEILDRSQGHGLRGVTGANHANPPPLRRRFSFSSMRERSRCSLGRCDKPKGKYLSSPDIRLIGHHTGKPRESLLRSGESVNDDSSVSASISCNRANLEAIDTYYKFVHPGFPLIPVSKETLLNDILFPGNENLGERSELDESILGLFLTSLRFLIGVISGKPDIIFLGLLDRKSVNQDGVDFHADAGGTMGSVMELNKGMVNGYPSGNEQHSMGDLNEQYSGKNHQQKDTVENVLNKVLHDALDLYNTLKRPERKITQRLSLLFLTTFVILCYVSSYADCKDADTLGLAVIVFNHFRVCRLFAPAIKENFGVAANLRGTLMDNVASSGEYGIVYKRLYILLGILDSFQSLAHGRPKLLNMNINFQLVDSLFGSTSADMCIERDQKRSAYLSCSLHLGAFVTALSMNRIVFSMLRTEGMCIARREGFLWLPDNVVQRVKEIIEDHHRSGTLLRDQTASIYQLFSDFLMTKQYLMAILTMQDLAEQFKERTTEITETLTTVLCVMVQQILQMLKLTMRINPTNSITQDLSSMYSASSNRNKIGSTQWSGLKNEDESTNVNCNSNYIASKGDEDEPRMGFVSPFAMAILQELANVSNLVRRVPALLITIIMKTSYDNNNKIQELVVRLSSCMNESLQVMNMLDMVKPYRAYDNRELHSRFVSGEIENEKKSVMRWYLMGGDDNMPNRTTLTGDISALEELSDIGWKLLDDTELGWCN